MNTLIKNKIAKIVKSYNVDSLEIAYCSGLRKYHKFNGIKITSSSGFVFFTAFIGVYDKQGNKINKH